MKNTITLALSDISAAGSIAAAIEAHCAEQDSISSGQVGTSFATSGPGSGWSRNYSARDYAKRALSDECGASAYIDSDDGRLATLDAEGSVEWTDESAVELSAPDESAVESDPATLSLMLDAIASGHCVTEPSKYSRKAWDTLRALATVSESDACGRCDIEIVGAGIIYRDDDTRRWYVGDKSDLRRLRILMGSADGETSRSAYSHWCAETTHEERETEEAARKAAAAL